MSARGHWHDGRYIPEPSVARFEIALAAFIQDRLCAGCGKPRGSGPLRAGKHRFYHPACAPPRREREEGLKEGECHS